MVQHGIAGLAGEALLAELARLVRLAGIECGGRATDDFFGGVLVHGKHTIFVIASEAKQSKAAQTTPRHSGAREA
jgi:hypothetical protein